SASIGPVFGQLLAWQFAEWTQNVGKGPIIWLEAGAHDGALASAILEWLGKNRPALLERMTYSIVEPSPTRRSWQEQTLRRHANHVRWSQSLEDWSDPVGVTAS